MPSPSDERRSTCRGCAGHCGLLVRVAGRALASVRGDPDAPTSAGFLCPSGVALAELASHPDRLRTPAVGGEPAGWDEALGRAAEGLRRARRAGGAGAVAIYAGRELAHDDLGAIRALALAWAWGTPHLFSPLAMHGAPLLAAAERMLGWPAALQADVGRAHFTLLLGADQDAAGWGPLQGGTVHLAALSYFQRTRRKAQLVAVDPRRTDLAARARDHLAIQPGTEVFFLLGLAHAILHGGQVDAQYLADHTAGLERVRSWLAPWDPARAAATCGLETADLSGVALRLARAPMATIARTRALTQHRHGTLAAWAWHLVHALTANLLRPGGVFEARGLVDLHPLMASFPSGEAPRGQAAGIPALLGQLPGTTLADELRAGHVRALLCVGGDPLEELPDPDGLARALDGLDLLVVVDALAGPTSRRADVVLPAASFLERDDIELLHGPFLPARAIQAPPALLEPPGEARPAHRVLRDLHRRVGSPLRGTGWGPHLRLLGRLGATADLDALADHLLRALGLPSLDALRAASSEDRGELDRATWRVTLPGERVRLDPEDIGEALRSLAPPVPDPERPLRLLATGAPPGGLGRWSWPTGGLPVAAVHPGTGLPDGAEARISTAGGEARVRLRHDPHLRPDTVVLPWDRTGTVGRLLAGAPLDPFTGAAELTGLPCRLDPA